MEEVAVFSLNNLQSSSLTFFGVLVPGTTLLLFAIKCSLALVIPPFITFPSNYIQLHLSLIHRLDDKVIFVECS